MNPRTSLIISTFNWPEALELTLISAAKQTVLPLEVVIADDGSREETRQMIERMQRDYPIPIRYVWHPDDGFRKTIILNRAFAEAEGDYLIQVDGDVMLHPRFVEDHLRFCRKGYFIAGARILTSEALKNRYVEEKNTDFSIFHRGAQNILNGIRWPFLTPLMYNYKGSEKDIQHVKGCNMAFWKEDIFRINGYDETFTGWGLEDSDIAVRLHRSGVKKRYLKFAGIMCHLWHKQFSRSREELNRSAMFVNIREGIVRCPQGIFSPVGS
ncbi:MAG: glycosyltransferase family 2 protein [Siphonobacter aquaeclarae]|jgi:glycosyltransferase involved in cell wall biosynthesis|nr:glycosyltransferase family 2 protein [Siphonobacter aquaeclarae]